LGCPKNQVDSDKLVGTLVADGYQEAESAEDADLVVVNTCAFIEAARQESIDTILELAEARHAGARLVVTGCMAERYGTELSDALPEVDLVAGFGVPVTLRRRNDFDLLNLPRPAARAPWAYIKVAEGCDRMCGFCAIPSFRGKQRSRPTDVLLDEVDALGDGVREVVLVAQDLASWGLDRTAPDRVARPRGSSRPIVELIRAVAARVERVRLLYLYPSALDNDLIETIVDSGVPYFDLSLQHVSRPLVERMRRWGEGARFLDRIGHIRTVAPDAALRSSFILGYPGETEEDHDALLAFLTDAQLDWAGFFTFSEEPGTYAADLSDTVAPELALERLRECSELQDRITAERRAVLVGRPMTVLIDAPGVGRTHREAPEIDGIIHVPEDLKTGDFVEMTATDAAGPDLWAESDVITRR
jgi:ribosomal protein S12 methylthiotransferase